MLKIFIVALVIAVALSLAVNVYFMFQNNNLSQAFAVTSSQEQALAKGTFLRNGTIFDEIGLQTDTLVNGTTVFFRDIAFIYIQSGYSTGLRMVSVSFQDGYDQTLTVNYAIPNVTSKTNEAYVHYQNLTAGIGVNVGDPSKVFLFVSVENVTSITQQ
jgi:hypothetical protein